MCNFFPSIIVLTYGRVRHLENALACLLAQDYPGKFEILVFNSCPEQTLVFNSPLVRIVNAVRPGSLGACRNEAIEYASGSHILIHDDDDACLPNFVSTFARGFADGSQWVQHGRQFYAFGDTIKDIVRGTLNAVGFTRDAWIKAGKYANMGSGEDRHFFGRLTAACHGRVLDIAEKDTAGIYNWGQGTHHISGLGEDSPRNNSYARAEADLKKRLRSKQEPSGTIVLQPKMRCNWHALTRAYLDKHGWLREKINGVGVIQMGRFGDIINTLPICKKLHDDGENPHLIVASEFASVLDGVSYVTPCVQDYPWVEIDRATRVAQSQFTKVLRLQLYGKGHKQEHHTASFNMEQWREAGLLEDFHNPEMKPVFDRRDAKREALLLVKLFRTDKPKIVANLTRSASSPFRNGPMLLSSIRTAFKNTHEVVEIGNLKLYRIYDLLAVIEKAALFISVDTATLHLAAATETPVLALVNDAPWLGSTVRYNDVATISYAEATKENVLGVVRDFLLPKAETPRMQIATNPVKTVSAVIAVYKPDMERLRRCIDSIVSQVYEVIVCYDLDTTIILGPEANCERVDFVRLEATATGYGRKANHGAKHATGDTILFLNDDVYLNPGTVAGLICEMRDNTAVVSHTLRFPNGTIQYGGKQRMPGSKNFMDSDFRKMRSQHKQPVEQESACGASMLVRRDVFEKVGGFDPSYFLYCEDDDISMRVRQAGYRIIFTPLVEGIHEANSSMALTPGWRDILHQSQKIFAERWGWYFQLNRNPRAIGVFPAAKPQPQTPPTIAPVADDPDFTRITGSAKRLNPSMTLVYIHVPGDPEHYVYAERFTSSYMFNPPQCDHETVVVMQGDADSEAIGMFKNCFKNLRIYTHDDSGWDIGGYIAAAKTINTDIMVCCGGSTFFRKPGWGYRMIEAWETHGPGFYGSNAVYDNTPHINTNGFWCAPEMLTLYPEKVVTKMNRYNFEHGQNSMWRILNAKGFPCKLVTWDGEFDWPEWRSQPNIFRRGDQSNCLTYWHHHTNYEQAGSELKRRLERGSDTLVDRKLLNQKPAVTLVYVYPSGEFRTDEHDRYAKRFGQTYIKFPPNYAHETIVVCNGGLPNDFIRALFRDIPCSFFEHDDSGWDIGAYLAVARAIKTEAMFCCGGLTSFKRAGWLKRMVDAWAANGRGLYGSLGSFQYGVKHFATTGFLCPTTLIRQYPKQVVTYEERAEFEHGANCITNLALKLGMKAKLVTWDGVYSLDEMRRPANVLNKGTQNNCLTYYKQTDIYDATNQQQKRLLQARVDGKT